MKKLCIRFASLMLGIFMLAGLNGCRKKEAAAPMALDFYAFSLGQADCLLLSYEGYHILIDAGETDDGEDICRALSELGIKKLDLLVVTHFDKDHIGGLPDVIGAFKVKKLYSPVDEFEAKPFEAMKRAADAKKLKITVPQAGQRFSLGSAKVEFLAPLGIYDNVNDISLVVKIT